ncbi:hypothetical protein EP7_000172 [Isosphaeraceae bacterium EP7]
MSKRPMIVRLGLLALLGLVGCNSEPPPPPVEPPTDAGPPTKKYPEGMEPASKRIR